MAGQGLGIGLKANCSERPSYMKSGFSKKRHNALTQIELLVIIFVIALAAAVLLQATILNRDAARRKACAVNLKEIAVVFQVGVGDQGDRYLTQVSTNYGGAKELVAAGDVAAVYMCMSNIMVSPKS